MTNLNDHKIKIFRTIAQPSLATFHIQSLKFFYAQLVLIVRKYQLNGTTGCIAYVALH